MKKFTTKILKKHLRAAEQSVKRGEKWLPLKEAKFWQKVYGNL